MFVGVVGGGGGGGGGGKTSIGLGGDLTSRYICHWGGK